MRDEVALVWKDLAMAEEAAMIRLSMQVECSRKLDGLQLGHLDSPGVYISACCLQHSLFWKGGS